MGHERVGILPKSARRTRLVHQMGGVFASEVPVGSPAAQTLQNVRKRYETLFQDDAVKSAGPVAGPRSAILTPTLCMPPTDRRGEGDRRMRGKGGGFVGFSPPDFRVSAAFHRRRWETADMRETLGNKGP